MCNRRYVQFPNGEIVRISADNQVVAVIESDFEDIFEMSGTDLRGWLAEMVTGEDDGLSNVSFRLIEIPDPQTIKIEVSGTIADVEVTEIPGGDIPEQEYEMRVTRVSFGSRLVRVSAKTLGDARCVASDDAGDHTYKETAAVYLIDGQPVKHPIG
ncbi:hypothetical protein BLA39750_01256 [Burkholderia lata]|uniref:Uncharacterized protein n=1 Tax=Burkholderia lata (strain ATCC 17760 / DSM 23089 / LMG 22485 / NCIMB 9086 / R18194 / 383) TaxID=482957 RepID=A0A6P2UWC0_BURL3|nr:hypothetical protein [Burkholderia lata]VWC81835.1 hypothetical protein BLA39750_01256 [Burkholderia lata]